MTNKSISSSFKNGNENLLDTGWKLDENGFYYHKDHGCGGYTECHALEICEYERRIKSLSDKLNVTSELLRIRYNKLNGDRKINYYVVSNPFRDDLFIDSCDSFKEQAEKIHELLNTKKGKEKGDLLIGIVKMDVGKVKNKDGKEFFLKEFYINIIYEWDGNITWNNIFGDAIRNLGVKISGIRRKVDIKKFLVSITDFFIH